MSAVVWLIFVAAFAGGLTGALVAAYGPRFVRYWRRTSADLDLIGAGILPEPPRHLGRWM
jgi:hypothetical protein